MRSLPSKSHIQFKACRSRRLYDGYSMCRSNRRSQPSVTILTLTIFTLFASTTIYVVAFILNYQSNILHFLVMGGGLFWSYRYNTPPAFVMPPGWIQDYTVFQSCTSSIALSINVCPVPTLWFPSKSIDSVFPVGRIWRRDCMLEDVRRMEPKPYRQSRLRYFLVGNNG